METKLMSDKMSGGGNNGQGVYSAAKEAIGSAAEQVRAAAPGTYDAGAKAARYVGDTATEHPLPVLAGTALMVLLGSWLLSSGRGNGSSDWARQTRDWQKRGYEMGDRVRGAAPSVSKVADDAGEYVSQTVRENPLSGVLVALAVGGVLGYLLQSRS